MRSIVVVTLGKLRRLAWVCLVLVAIAWIGTGPAYGHKPDLDEGKHDRWEDALVLEDTSVSRVFYEKLTPESSEFWLTFNAEAGERVFLQLGVPFVERLGESTPSIAVVGPRGPIVETPFDLPPGTGAWIYQGRTSGESVIFHEPITDTRSWILFEATHRILQGGQHYIVAYHPVGDPDKLWVAVGTREVFGLSDIVKLPKWILEVRRFHEVGPMPRWAVWITIAVGTLVVFWLAWLLLKRRLSG